MYNYAKSFWEKTKFMYKTAGWGQFGLFFNFEINGKYSM